MNTTVPLARYRFTFRMNSAVRLPVLAGSALRGVFGYALRHLSCMTRARQCTGCLLLAQCPFPAVFAPHELQKPAATFAASIQQIPVPYIIEPPLGGAQLLEPGMPLVFNMVLVGNALQQLPLITLAWQRALARGMTSSHGTGDLQRVEWLPPDGSALLIYSAENPRIAEHQPRLALPAFTDASDVHLHLLTPLRIEIRKKALGKHDISAAVFLRHLVRRISLLLQFHAADQAGTLLPESQQALALNALADAVQDERELMWQDWARYSTRQQQEIPLGGLTGRWLMKQVPPALLPYLYLGQWLHAGKETAFGLGRYEQTDTEWQKDTAGEIA